MFKMYPSIKIVKHIQIAFWLLYYLEYKSPKNTGLNIELLKVFCSKSPNTTTDIGDPIAVPKICCYIETMS